MVETRNTIRGLDTGQLSQLNRLDTSRNQETKFEMIKSVKNQQRNANSNESTNANENGRRLSPVNNQRESQIQNETTTRRVQFQEDVMMEEVFDQERAKQSEKKGISIEIEMNPESEAQECAITIVTVAEQLLKKWTMKKVIDGVYGVNGNLIKAQYEKIDKWAIEPKIVKKNKYVAVELIMDVKSKESVFKLYQHVKEYCNTHKIRLSARNTKLEYTKRVGFLTGPCLKIAAPKRYIEELNKYLGLEEEDGIIDIKKKFTFERGSRSKVLMICVIESKSKEADELLCTIRSP